MEISKKISLGLASIVIAALPFCMRSKPQEELVDILCRDVYEQVSEYSVGVRGYDLAKRKVLVMGYSEEDLNAKDKNGVSWEGMDLKDTTPKIIAGQKAMGCRIVDPNDLSFRDFSQQELSELEQIARENIKYRALEREIYDDVAKNGEIYTTNCEPVIDVPILRDLWTREVPITKRKEYKIDDELTIEVPVDVVKERIISYKLVISSKTVEEFFSNGPLGVFYTYKSCDEAKTLRERISNTWIDRMIEIIRKQK